MDDRNTQYINPAYDVSLSVALKHGRKTEERILRYQKQISDMGSLAAIPKLLVTMLSTTREINSDIVVLVGSANSGDTSSVPTGSGDKLTSLNAIWKSIRCTDDWLIAYKARRQNDASSQTTIENIKPISEKIAHVKADTQKALDQLRVDPENSLACQMRSSIPMPPFEINPLITDDFFRMLKTIADGMMTVVEFQQRANQPTDDKRLKELYKRYSKT